MAWDRRLLARTQHLTLIISGLRGTYPILKSDGSYQENAMRQGSSLAFKVGLTQRYKPSKEHTTELVRNFGLVVADEETPDSPTLLYDENGDPVIDEWQPPSAQRDPEEENDPGRFEKFSLSASLESLLENQFLRVLQLRIKFTLGWAGAEMLLAQVESLQRVADELYPQLKGELRAADKRERLLSMSYTLPLDPLKERDATAPVNLPQVAFAYLLRRLMVLFRTNLFSTTMLMMPNLVVYKVLSGVPQYNIL